MKAFLLVTLVSISCVTLVSAQTEAINFNGKFVLDMEKENGFTVTNSHYEVLDRIYKKVNEKVIFKPIVNSDEAHKICLAISAVLEKDFGFKYGETLLLSDGLSNVRLDCNFYSIIFYDILNKQHNYKVFPVLSPGHMFIRWHLSATNYINYETTSKELIKDNEYIALLGISAQSVKNKTFLADINENQLLATNYVEMAGALSDDKIKEKEILCKKAMQLDSKCFFVQMLKASNYIAKTEYDSAITFYNNLLFADSANYVIANRIGLLYTKMDKHELADKFYTKAIKQNANDPKLYIDRSKEYLRVNNVDKAMADFDLASAKLKMNNLFSFLFDYVTLTVLEQEIMDKYLEGQEKKK